MTSVQAPKWEYLPREELYEQLDGGEMSDEGVGLPNCEVLKNHLAREGRLNPKDAIELVQRAADILKREANLLILQDPITVCGDIHGQYFDLLKLLSISGPPSPKTRYLFLGDYVDRGYFGTEVTFLLLAYKIRYPDCIFLIRGNHECRHLTAYFNFKQECLFKYNEEVYDAIMNCFDCLPLGALLNGRFLCVHGGLSPEIKTIEEINIIERFREPPNSGPMCDLLWADPMDEEEEDLNPNATFSPNELRGCSYVFSYNAAYTFLKHNNLLSVIRAHEAQDEGYRLYKKGATTGFPTVICIFSAPNYCDVYNNKGAIIRFKDNLMNIRQFNCSPHPYYLPNFMNAFNWSMPFVVEKVMDMFQVILRMCNEQDLEEHEPQERVTITKDRAEKIKSKIRAVGRLSRMYRTLREERESIVALKGLAGGNIPKGLLMQGPTAIRQAVESFEQAKKCDQINEKIPAFKMPPPMSRSLSQQELAEKLKSVPRVRASTPPQEKIEIRINSKSSQLSQ